MNFVLAIIGIPILLFFCWVTGIIVRAVILKESQLTQGIGNIVKSIIIGGIAIAIFGVIFKGCNGGLENVIKE